MSKTKLFFRQSLWSSEEKKYFLPSPSDLKFFMEVSVLTTTPFYIFLQPLQAKAGGKCVRNKEKRELKLFYL